MDAIECILKRASVRKYQDHPVERELIEKLLLCGFHAPTAGNSRAWQFVVVQNRDTLARMSLAAPGHACLKGASLAIVACVDWKKDQRPVHDNSEHGVAAACENILLAAHGLGLGGVWLASYPRPQVMNYLRELLSIPSDVDPYAVLSLGYPDESPAPKGLYEPDAVHFEAY